MRNVEFILCLDCDYKYVNAVGQGNEDGKVEKGSEKCDMCDCKVKIFIYRKATRRLWKAFLDSLGVMSHEREGE